VRAVVFVAMVASLVLGAAALIVVDALRRKDPAGTRASVTVIVVGTAAVIALLVLLAGPTTGQLVVWIALLAVVLVSLSLVVRGRKV
jgi:hypothetical protein